jgi:rhodanese-related sulfurtransferase
MKNKNWNMALGLTFLLLFAFTMPAYGGGDEIPRISTEQLKDILGNSDLVVLDGRIRKDWKKNDRKIAGAVRVDPHDVSSWAGDFSKDQKIVVYCS